MVSIPTEHKATNHFVNKSLLVLLGQKMLTVKACKGMREGTLHQTELGNSLCKENSVMGRQVTRRTTEPHQ